MTLIFNLVLMCHYQSHILVVIYLQGSTKWNSTCVKLCVTSHILTNKLLFYLSGCLGCIEEREYKICSERLIHNQFNIKKEKIIPINAII